MLKILKGLLHPLLEPIYSFSPYYHPRVYFCCLLYKAQPCLCEHHTPVPPPSWARPDAAASDFQIAYWEVFDGSVIRELEGSLSGSINGMDITAEGVHFVTGQSRDRKRKRSRAYFSGNIGLAGGRQQEVMTKVSSGQRGYIQACALRGWKRNIQKPTLQGEETSAHGPPGHTYRLNLRRHPFFVCGSLDDRNGPLNGLGCLACLAL